MVTHDWDGQLRRIPIPVKWVVLFVAFAVVGAGTLAGLAGSYGRMLTKVQSFNEMRTRQDMLVRQLSSARSDADQFQSEVASLGSLASEVTALYSFKHSSSFKDRLRNATPAAAVGDAEAVDVVDPVNTADADGISGSGSAASMQTAALYSSTLSNFQILETTALDNSLPQRRAWSPFGQSIWQPDRWPVRGRITSSFGERIDPFLGEGAFHDGIDIAVPYDTPVDVTADGLVVFAGIENGYGRTVIVDHGHGVRTLYAHMASLAVTVGQRVDRGEVVGYVGVSGWSTGPHLHYEVRVNRAPVNPYRYLHP